MKNRTSEHLIERLAAARHTPAIALATAMHLCVAPGAVAQPDCDSPGGCTCRILNTPDAGTGIYITSLWPGGIVPFDFDPAVTPENRSRALAAMETIEAVCDANFVPRVGEIDFVRIFNGDDSAWVGRRGGQQPVNIRSWESHVTIVHELIHSLGAWHEHQRADRDSFVTINAQNVPPDADSQRQFEIRAGTTFGWYDFDSVMHYPRFSRSVNGSPTIAPRPGFERWTHRLGQATRLSTGDVWLLTEMYGGPRPPGAFDLVAPAPQGALVGAPWSPAFSWTPAELADSYRLLVDDDPAFGSPEIDVVLTETAFTGGSLADNTLYHWTVAARNETGETEPWFTPVGAFYTAGSVPPVIYVDDSAPAGVDGASWATPFVDLQDAIALAACAGGGAVEMRVAGGAYTPDRGTGDRHASFILRSNVTIRGGYAGYAAPDPDARDITGHVTVISGDLAGDDAPGFVNRAENSIHVVHVAGQRTGPATLDGVTIAGGNADLAAWPYTGTGGGLWADDSEIHLIHCTLAASGSSRDGAGAYLLDSDVLMRGCTVTGNRVASTYGSVGGGLAADYGAGTLTLEGCTISENQAPGAGGAFLRWCTASVRDSSWVGNVASTRPGGGLWLVSSNAAVTSTQFVANTSGNAGGGAAVAFNSHADFANCLFAGNSRPNTAASPGGGLWVGDGVGTPASVTLVNCTFSGNSSPGAAGGGALGVTQTSTVVGANCIFWGDSPTEIAQTGTASATLSHCDVQGTVWSGPGNISADPLFADAGTGDYRPARLSPCIDAGDNSALSPDVMTDLAALPRFRNDAWTPDTGLIDPTRAKLPIIDMGAHEFQGNSCIADYNDDGFLNSQDLFDFLSAFFAGEADFNADGFTNSQDLFDFLAEFFTGCV